MYTFPILKIGYDENKRNGNKMTILSAFSEQWNERNDGPRKCERV